MFVLGLVFWVFFHSATLANSVGH